MIQEQTNFLEGFEAYLTRKGFRVGKSTYDVDAFGEAVLFDTPVSCCFHWKLYGLHPSVRLQLWIGSVMMERWFPAALLMDYAGEGVEIFTIMIRGVMRDAADLLAVQFN